MLTHIHSALLEETGPIIPLLVSLTAGMQVARWVGEQVGGHADEIWVNFKIFKILHRLNYLDFYFVKYHCNVTTVLELHFNRLLSSNVYFMACFEVQKFDSNFFMSIPTMRY